MNLIHVNEEARIPNHEVLHLHGGVDRAVLASRCWADLAQTAHCEFLLDYEEEEDDEPGKKKSKKKKPWRYRWPNDFRDKVLARLLELNEQRAKEEALVGKAIDAKEDAKAVTKRVARSSKTKPDSTQNRLF